MGGKGCAFAAALSLGCLEDEAMVRLLLTSLLQELGHFLLHTVSLR
jgi:hypothetical protein